MANSEWRMEIAVRQSLIALPYSPFAIRYSPIMSMRSRKLIGTVVLFVLVTIWALLAMALAQSALTDTNFWIAALYYAVAGLGWVLPAMPLIRWMLRPEADGEQRMPNGKRARSE
ncbi:MAG: DUF2842 domain-containing protein [Xanthobacteraceae bacterium]|jgi:Protein of unknown function (DUF2842)